MHAYREKGYISHATPKPMATNRKNSQAACLARAAVRRCAKQASASETSAAKTSRAGKWPSRKSREANQRLRPRAISNASITLRIFTTPAAAIKRVP